jgi:molybdate transport system substrate-binding protein
MKIRPFVVGAAQVGFMLLFAVSITAESAELKVLSAIGMKEAMEDLGPKFERATGHKLNISFAIGGVIVKRIQNGETGDLVMLPQPGIDSLTKDGKLVRGSQVIIARSGIGVAVRKGAAKPDVSSPEALKRALLAAKSITYSNPADGGASGVHFAKVLDRLGITAEVKSKTVFPKIPGEIGQVVARGEAEIAVGQNQVLISVPEIEIVGPLPGDLQDTIVFSAAMMTGAKETKVGRALIDFLRAPEAAAEIKAKGMEPATP